MAPRDFDFAHLADAHVGAWPRDPAVRAALRESVLEALRTVAERGADFLLISGDLFHTPVPDPDEVAPVAAALRGLAARGIRVYLIFGSHDYVAQRTSWLDVLAETGLFVRVAPEAVRAGEERWQLPFLLDEPTGAVIAGISGRSHGLDREYYRSMDSGVFARTPGFRIFMFHAAIREYLPPGLQAHIPGVARDDLPQNVDYYAGGHIHASYVGKGPTGGLLVNPGAVFGTNLTDIAQGATGRTHRGLVLVSVRSGVPTAEFIDTLRPGTVDVFDVDLSGKSPEEARSAVREEVRAHSVPGVLLFPHLTGVGDATRAAELGLFDTSSAAAEKGAASVHWDLADLASEIPTAPLIAESESQLEDQILQALGTRAPLPLPELAPDDGTRRVRELIRELGLPPGDGEAREDYRTARVNAGLRVLGIRRPGRELSRE
ncbi:MAG: metallophosphoesterase family protein [Thermoplasmata archaeon]|nr:metallophosphoesterase family protein [Thermoplasmata archaeon]